MWLFTTLGFFSVTQSKFDRGQFQIRARLKSDLETLNDVFGMGCRLIETPTADYRWRVTISPEQLTEVFAMLPSTILYPNFKDAVHHTHGQESKGGPYMRVWSVMKDLQDREERGPAADEPPAFPGWLTDGEPVLPIGARAEDVLAEVGVHPLHNPKAKKVRKKKGAADDR